MTHIVVIGPGAIGGAVGGALLESGNQPTFAARQSFTDFEVVHPEGRVEARVDCVTEPREISKPADVVFLGVKAHQTAGTAGWLDASVGAQSTLVVLQNGVEHVERLRPLVPTAAAIVPAVVALPARREAPGRIRVSGRGSLAFPESAEARRVEALFASAFLRIRVVDDWTSVAWQKLLLNAAAGGIGTLTRRDNRMFAEDPDGRALVLALMKEVARVARAEGASITDEDVESLLESLIRRAGAHLSSIVVDRIEGRPTEWDARNAVVERIAARHGIDVPMNRMLTTLIRLGEPEGSRWD